MIELPWPPRELHPNGRPAHWAVKAKLTKIARTYSFMAAKEARWGVAAGDVPVMLRWTFHPKTRHAVDRDNLIASTKAYADGIADALRIDDKHFRSEYVVGEPIKGGKITVELL